MRDNWWELRIKPTQHIEQNDRGIKVICNAYSSKVGSIFFLTNIQIKQAKKNDLNGNKLNYILISWSNKQFLFLIDLNKLALFAFGVWSN